jgi:hypothetical protein
MGTNLTFKRTVDLSPQQCEQMKSLFFSVFAREMRESAFERWFMRSPMGYSYHGLMLHDDEIVGSFSAIPYRYRCFGTERMFALSVDTMISPQHRGGKTNLVTMAHLAYEAMIKDGINFIYGFPNELYYAHEKRILGTRDIGKLNYYVLPINIGTAIQKFKVMNYPSRLFAGIMAKLPASRDMRKREYDIEKINDEQFIKHRYDGSYDFLSLSGGRSVFKIYSEQGGAKALHILDVWPMTPAAMDETIREVLLRYGSVVDLILYVGRLPFSPRRLVKVPQGLEPQKIRMTGKILVEGAVPESIFDIDNWNVNVSNFDVR